MTHASFVMSSKPEDPTPGPQPTEKLRPLAGDGGQARAESELWELDKEDNGAGPESAKNQEPEEERRDSVRKWVAGPLEKQSAQKKENRKKTGVRLDIQPRGVTRPAEQLTLPPRRVEQEFSQLDDWEEEAASAIAEPVASVEVDPAPMDPMDLHPDPSAEEVSAGSEADAEEDVAVPIEETQPFDEVRVKPTPQAGKLSTPMKRMEWAGLAILAVLIAALAVGAYFWSIYLLPNETPRWQQMSFPVKGEHFEIKNATTYWRAPVVEGPDKDPIRRGTRLIPIVELELSGGPAALRVIFRDDEGRGVGDPIIRHVASPGKIALAATAGFEDPGMHAAYRTEELDPWSVEVSEASGVDSPGSDFSQILKMNLSSDLR